jgi:hypothetical protein
VMIECKLHLDAAHVRDHVRGLREILEYSESFGQRFHGNIATFADGLWDDLGEFEERTGKIGFSSEFHSLPLMRQKFVTVLDAATAFTMTQFGEIFSKAPVDPLAHIFEGASGSLAKGKDCGDIHGKLTDFVQTAVGMLKRLHGALDSAKQRVKISTLNQPRVQDTQDMQAHPANDSPKTTVAVPTIRPVNGV